MTLRYKVLCIIVTTATVLGLAACAATSTSTHSTPTLRSPAIVYTFGVAGTNGKVVQTRHTTPTPISGIAGSVTQIATSNSDTYG